MQEDQTGCRSVIFLVLRSTLKGALWALLAGSVVSAIAALPASVRKALVTMLCAGLILVPSLFLILLARAVHCPRGPRPVRRRHDPNDYDDYPTG